MASRLKVQKNGRVVVVERGAGFVRTSGAKVEHYGLEWKSNVGWERLENFPASSPRRAAHALKESKKACSTMIWRLVAFAQGFEPIALPARWKPPVDWY